MRMGMAGLLLVALVVVSCGGDEPEKKDPTAEPAAGTTDDAGKGTGGVREWKDKPVVDPLDLLERKSRSRSLDYRWEALEQIGELTNVEDAVRLLEPMLNDSEAEIRTTVVEMLGSLKAKSSFSKFRMRLQTEEDPGVRAVLVTAVGNLSGVRAISDMIEIAGNWDESDTVRVRAMYFLGEFKDESALEGLHEIAADLNPKMRHAAVEALAKIASVKSIDAIGDRVADDASGEVRIAGSRGLAAIGKKRAAKYLVRALDTDDPELLSEVVAALRKLTNESFGYDDMKQVDQNAAAVKGWLDWWEGVKGSYE